jgi:NADH:ubiquinone oxidoreductase subunit K
VLSGLVDIAIGLAFVSGAIEVKGSPVAIFVICFATGMVYLGLGILIAVVRMRRQKRQ